MESETSLDDALGEPKETPVVEETPVAEEAKPAEEPESSPPEEESWTKAAALDERQKRQEAEQQLQQSRQLIAQYEGYLKGLQPEAQQEQEQDFYSNPDEYLKGLESKIEQKFTQQLQQSQRATMNQVLNISEKMVAQVHEDFPQVKEHFLKMVQANPQLGIQIQQADNPWQTAYDLGKRDMELAEVGSVDAYRDKIRTELEAEVRAKLLEELKADAEKSGKVTGIPKSLVSEPSKGTVTGPQWSGPTSLDSIL